MISSILALEISLMSLTLIFLKFVSSKYFLSTYELSSKSVKFKFSIIFETFKISREQTFDISFKIMSEPKLNF